MYGDPTHPRKWFCLSTGAYHQGLLQPTGHHPGEAFGTLGCHHHAYCSERRLLCCTDTKSLMFTPTDIQLRPTFAPSS